MQKLRVPVGKMPPSPPNRNSDPLAWNLLFAGWVVATFSALGSLFFSEVLNFPPCKLCWYQRICLFPLVLILLAGLFPLSKQVVKFAFPLTAVGWIISAYHNLLYYGVIPEPLSPCDKNLSCTETQLNVLGFITIPLLSFGAFSILGGILILLHRRLSQ